MSCVRLGSRRRQANLELVKILLYCQSYSRSIFLLVSDLFSVKDVISYCSLSFLCVRCDKLLSAILIENCTCLGLYLTKWTFAGSVTLSVMAVGGLQALLHRPTQIIHNHSKRAKRGDWTWRCSSAHIHTWQYWRLASNERTQPKEQHILSSDSSSTTESILAIGLWMQCISHGPPQWLLDVLKVWNLAPNELIHFCYSSWSQF